MLAQFGAMLAAVCSVVQSLSAIRFRIFATVTVAALVLAGCKPATVPLAGADPADLAAEVAGVGYRSTVAPYSSLRPAVPLSWREQNDRAAPASKPDR